MRGHVEDKLDTSYLEPPSCRHSIVCACVVRVGGGVWVGTLTSRFWLTELDASCLGLSPEAPDQAADMKSGGGGVHCGV